MMSFKRKMQRWVKNRYDEIERGREVTAQMKAERLRKRQEKYVNMKEGAVKDIWSGIMNHDTPINVMKKAYHRRKYERRKTKD